MNKVRQAGLAFAMLQRKGITPRDFAENYCNTARQACYNWKKRGLSKQALEEMRNILTVDEWNILIHDGDALYVKTTIAGIEVKVSSRDKKAVSKHDWKLDFETDKLYIEGNDKRIIFLERFVAKATEREEVTFKNGDIFDFTRTNLEKKEGV